MRTPIHSRRGIWLAAAAAAVTAVGLLSPAVASASTDEATHASLTFTQSGAARLHVQGGRFHPGTVITRIVNSSSKPHQLIVVGLVGSTTIGKVVRDISADIGGGPAGAAATVRLTREAHFVGGADVAPGEQTTYTTVGLARGTYYALDGAAASPRRHATVLGSVRVSGAARQTALAPATIQVYGNSADRFVPARSTWPTQGTVRFRDTSDTIHFMDLAPVRRGTTDAQIQAFFDGHGKPPFVRGPGVGAEVLSPGVAEEISYRLPAGDYVLLCFVTDDMTGAPHAIMGMHKVIHVR